MTEPIAEEYQRIVTPLCHLQLGLYKDSMMEMKPLRPIYFTMLLFVLVTIGPMLGGCARVYYGTFRYDAECVDRDPHYPDKGPDCVLERTK